MKIICIGRNYAKHAKEMNSDVPTEPMFFFKPDTALLKERFMHYPEFTKELHYETEIVLKISKVGKHIPIEFAKNYYNQIGLGIDFTARDIQLACKKKGHPWEKAKAFDNSAALSNKFIGVDTIENENINFSLKINGEEVQVGNTSDMIFQFDELISYVSKFVTLKKGDLIYTGTPEGVGEVSQGDVLKGYIENQEMFKIKIL